jgi:hypothetical protein
MMLPYEDLFVRVHRKCWRPSTGVLPDLSASALAPPSPHNDQPIISTTAIASSFDISPQSVKECPYATIVLAVALSYFQLGCRTPTVL